MYGSIRRRLKLIAQIVALGALLVMAHLAYVGHIG